MGKLVLFSLPIGNKEDLTLRTKDILSQDGIFLAEDTRTLKDFIRLVGEKTDGKTFVSFHEHNDEERLAYVLKLLEENQEVYLTSDAGSPIISDPAFPIIREALREGHEIGTMPGASSVITALELSGLPPYPFTFYGFLPKEKGKRLSIFENLPHGTNIFFESPHRIMDTLKILKESKVSCEISVCREMTKKFETVYRFRSDEIEDYIKEITPKGEFVLCVYLDKSDVRESGHSKRLVELTNKYLSEKGSKKDLAKILALITNEKTKTIYDKLSH